MRRWLLISMAVFAQFQLRSQTLGGSTVFNFLKLPNAPQLTALGGINISQITNDIGLAYNNPALLRNNMHTQTQLSFNSLKGGLQQYHLMAGYHHEALNTNFALGVQFMNYGSVPQTDLSGNVNGEFRPVDYVVQASASRQYLNKWHYGASLKFIHSSYGIYRSSGLALDIGISYYDSASLWQASFAAKNMGAQLTAYAGSEKEELPFDLQLGISKRLANAPLQFSITAWHLQRFDIRYEDTAFNAENGFEQNGKGKDFFFDKLFRHVVIGAQCYVTDKIELSLGYNHMRRKELNAGTQGNGLNGFSLGVGALFKKLQIRYARSWYQRNIAFNQFGLSFRMNDYLGTGK
ncbi:type IX secretion system protein PorQ [Pseudoflavitalea rhizosphaerae]|uniref:type IX secretion system protein PorQ n=1 Tax=Pseudoflavitalea rhizosphaerae TaxID=1884793 RepID=UPI000F8DDC5C|nr:type IX secretion system protein PorQ [Pseudoflavitalea rhizosphaerae]